MSTRAQIIIRDIYGDELWFYRHSDGYKDGVKPTLDQFCQWVNEGKIRDNASQASGWLVILGHKEYDTVFSPKMHKKNLKDMLQPYSKDTSMGWKVGAYEPCCPQLHMDTACLYLITLKKGKASWKQLFIKAYEKKMQKEKQVLVE